MTDTKPKTNPEDDKPEDNDSGEAPAPINLQKRKGEVEPTRYGDWEMNGRCIDF